MTGDVARIAAQRANARQKNICKGIAVSGLMVAGLFAASCAAQAQTQSRITTAIRSDQMQILKGTVHPMVAAAHDVGQLSGSTMIHGMSLVFRLSAAQQADLKNLLQQQQTKGSSMYHQWLQPGQFVARYGVSQQDLAKVAAWLQAQGFTIDAIPASADRIDFSGTAAQVQAAFQTQLHRYTLHGQAEWANATDLSLPQPIAGMSIGVEHLNTFRPVPHFAKRPVQKKSNHSATSVWDPHYTLQDQNNNQVNFLAPSDASTIYDSTGLYNNGITGKGQTMAVVGQTDITQYQNDIKNFRTLSGLNASNLPTQILMPNTGSNQVVAGDLEEADIDVEWSGAVAQDATILYVTVGNNLNFSVFDALQYAIQTPLISNSKYVPVISISYGNCESVFAGSTEVQAMEQSLQQANAQGQTVVAATGDSGSADCDTGTNSRGQVVGATQGLAVDYPASSQYVTGAGGTSFSGDLTNQSKYWNQQNNANNGSAISYIPETTWNGTPTLADLTNPNIGDNLLSASGGGASTLFAKPAWQVGPGVPGDGKRDVPDLSLAADPNHDGYVLCTEETNSAGTALLTPNTSSCVYPVGSNEVAYFDASGNGYLYGGTSIAAPQLAAMITLWNQEAGNTSGVGNANPIFYSIAQSTPGAFHDVVTGSNAVVCQPGSPNCAANGVMSCCSAGTGYDQATGLGSVDVAALGAVWPAISVTGTSNPVPTFSMVPNPVALSIKDGSSGTITLGITPAGGFTGTIALTCANLPANTTCGFAPSASVNITSNTAQNVTLTLANTASARMVMPQHFHRNWPMETVFASIFGLSLLGVGRKRRFPSRWVSRWMAVLLLSAGLMAATLVTACGGGSAGSAGASGNSGGSTTTTGTATTITVTGTSANTSVADHIQLTITS